MTKFCLISLLLFHWYHLVVSLEGSFNCHVYVQKILSNKFNINELPDTILHTPDCKACYAYIDSRESKLTSFCVGSTISAKETNTRLCLKAEANSEHIKCDHRECCCYGNDCFDRMRKHFTESTADGKHACPVQRTFSLEEPIDMRLNPAFKRLTCGACYAKQIRKSIEMSCIEYKNVNSVCNMLVDFVGGALACSEDGRECCCQGETCQDEFKAFFFKIRKLPKSLINQPYSVGTYPTLSHACFFVHLALLFWLNR